MSQTYNPSGTVGSTLKEATDVEAASGTGGQTYLRDNIRVIANKIRFLLDTGLPQLDGLLDISGASGGQIKFPASQNASSNANTLDDYEEGSWTPADGSGAALSFSSASGTYTKIGREVKIRGAITFPSTADATATVISGLPFTCANTDAAQSGNVVWSNASVGFFARVLKDTATIRFYSLDGAGRTNAAFTTNTVQFEAQYHV